ncbi:MAG: GNAT family acetyltransferase [Alphaproteobacteria bacterium]|nr:GNAT family acetyltransferase [Alphaproteobacteria bacterium]MCB9930438.1 GNAT family acetyltransferase [Alphaproteobacteria bacterium]
MRIRPFREADRAPVLALWADCGLTRPWNPPEDDLDRALTGPASAVLVAEDAATLVGSVMVGDDGHRGWVYYLSARPDRQKQGIGAALMRAAEDWLRARGVRKVELMVRSTNAAALGFYDRLGYEREPVAVCSHWLTDTDPRTDNKPSTEA